MHNFSIALSTLPSHFSHLLESIGTKSQEFLKDPYVQKTIQISRIALGVLSLGATIALTFYGIAKRNILAGIGAAACSVVGLLSFRISGLDILNVLLLMTPDDNDYQDREYRYSPDCYSTDGEIYHRVPEERRVIVGDGAPDFPSFFDENSRVPIRHK